MKKRMLFLVQLPPPHHGAAYMNDRIARLVGKMDGSIESRVIDLSKSRNSNEIGAIGITKVFKVLGTYLNLVKLLITFRPQLVFFNFSSRGVALLRDYLYCLVMKVFRAKYVLYLQISGFDKRAEESKLWRFIYKSSFRNAQVVTLSERLSSELIQLTSRTPLTLPNGIDPCYADITKPAKSSDRILKVLFLSNLMVEKGLYDIIQALEEANKKGFQFEFQIIGAEADISSEELAQSLEKHKIAHCSTYLGSKYNDEKWKALMSADIFVFPSHKEALPLVILEAMNCGLPIVASEVGGVPDLIEDGVSGLLFKPQDINDLSTKLVRLIGDASLREKLAYEANTRFNNYYTNGHFEQRLVKLLEQLKWFEK